MLQEIRGELASTDELYYGGSASVSFATDVFLTLANGRVQSMTPQAGSLKAFLPDTATIPTGAPHFVVFNRSGSFSFDLRDASDAAVDTVAVSSTVQVGLLQVDATTKQWVTY